MFAACHSTTLDAAEPACGCLLEEAELCAGTVSSAARHVLEEDPPRSNEPGSVRVAAGWGVASHVLEGGATS